MSHSPPQDFRYRCFSLSIVYYAFLFQAANIVLFCNPDLNHATFLLILVNPFAYFQVEQNNTNFCADKRAVCLGNQFIFLIENPQKVGSFTSAERAIKISERIQMIADSSIDIDDLTVENWQKTITVRAPNTVIVTLNDEDIKAAKINIKDKEKLAYQYLERIKISIKSYRENIRFNKFFGWVKPIFFLLLSALLIWLFIIIFLYLLTCLDIDQVSFIGIVINLKKMRFFFQNYDFQELTNYLGRLIEVIVFLITIVLVLRLILIAFNINKEAFFVDNLTATDTEKLFGQSLDILQVIGLIFLFGIVSLLLRWLSRKGKSTVLIPFEDATGGQYNGKVVADLLVEELHRIKQIHLLSKKFKTGYDVKLENIELPSIEQKEDLDNYLLDSGTVDIGGSKFSLGKLFLILQYLWPFGGVYRVISGTIHEIDNPKKLSLIVRLDDPNKGGIWKVTSEGKQNELLSVLIRDMAYKFSFNFANNITAKHWKSFKFFTEGISNFYDYKLTNSTSLLKQAVDNCIQAKENEFDYKKISDLSYNLGVEYFRNFYQKKGGKKQAVKMFDLAIKVNSKNAFAYNGRGNIYVCEGKYEEAKGEYQKAIKLNRSFWQPHHNLGYLYSRQKRYDDAIKEYNQAIQAIHIDSDSYCIVYSGLGWTNFLKVIDEKRDLPLDTIPLIWLLFRQYNCMAGILFLRKSPKSWTKKELENEKIQEELKKAKRYAKKGCNKIFLVDLLKFFGLYSEQNKDWKYKYLIKLGVITLWLGKKEEAFRYWDEGLDLISDGSQNEINKKLYTYAKNAISTKISESDLESEFKDFKNFISSLDTAREKKFLEEALEDADILARLPQEYQPKKIDEIVSMLSLTVYNRA